MDMTERTQAEEEVPEELKNLQDIDFIFAADDLCIWGARQVLCAFFQGNMKTNALDCNTIPANISEVADYSREVETYLENGILNTQTIYVTTDLERYNKWQTIFRDGRAEFCVWEKDDYFGTYYFMVPAQS